MQLGSGGEGAGFGFGQTTSAANSYTVRDSGLTVNSSADTFAIIERSAVGAGYGAFIFPTVACQSLSPSQIEAMTRRFTSEKGETLKKGP